MRRQALAALLLASAASAQPAQPPPASSEPVENTLAAAPIITLRNGRITAQVAVPDLKRGFFRGTRFDQAGVVTSLKLDGREFYGPWFERTAPEVLDYAYDAGGRVVAGPDSAASGPVEEFAQLGFEEARPGDLFVKIGVGALRRPDAKPYDKYFHYEIADWGQRSVRHTRDGVTFTQALTGPAGYAYLYEKTLRLLPGTTQMAIEHRLTNTGTRSISGNVYDHNFLRLVADNDGIQVTFPFVVAAASPPPADLIRIDGKTITYLRPMRDRERISFPVTGFGASAADYDFRISDTKSGAGVAIAGDRPVTRINIFSIDRVQAVEPYITIDLAPGAQTSWRYLYTYTTGR